MRARPCVPIDLHPGLVDTDPWVDLARLATLGDQILVIDPGERVAVLGASASTRASDLRSGIAPEFTLPDLDGAAWSLADQRGRKTVVVAFASWCGCAYELPGWQALHDELADQGFGVVAVAVDEDPEAVRPFTEHIGFPVLIDRDRVFADRYALTNVPTVVWVDEQGDMVRGQDVAFPTDTFREFHRIDSTDHLDGIRRWVRTGEAPADDVEAHVPDPDEQLAHLHYRLALHLWRADSRTRPSATSTGPPSWRPSTSPCAGPCCHCRARTRSSARSSSRCGPSGTPPAARTTAAPPDGPRPRPWPR